MAQVKYYPIKPKKQRVQFSADELELLFTLVWEKFKDNRIETAKDQTAAVLMAKLANAHHRLSA